MKKMLSMSAMIYEANFHLGIKMWYSTQYSRRVFFVDQTACENRFINFPPAPWPNFFGDHLASIKVKSRAHIFQCIEENKKLNLVLQLTNRQTIYY